MCGRYTLCHFEHLRQVAHELGCDYDEATWVMLNYRPRYNIAPSQVVPVIFDEAPRAITPAKWGLLPFWAKEEKEALFNARAETVAEKRAFKSAFEKRRCLVLADGFYEWKKIGTKGRQPFRFTMKDGAFFFFAGLWQPWKNSQGQEVRTFTLITTEPNAVTQPVHDRMPVILPPEKQAAWMAKETTPEQLKAMLVPYDAEAMKATAVSTAVNNARNEGPELIRPLPEQGQLMVDS